MSTKRTHDEHAENLGAYALGALPELEARVFERHLMACDACQEELQHLTEAVEALPRSVTPYEPPASLKNSLMDVVNAEGGGARGELAPKRRRWRALLPQVPRLRTAAAWAASVVIAGGLAAYGASELGGDEDRGPRTLAAAVDAQRLPGARASLLVPDNDGRGAVLRVNGLPDPGRGRVYQVWIERRGEVVPVSIFDVDVRGAGAAAVPEALDDVTAVMVTRERDGGASAPTEKPLLRVDV